LTVRDSTFTDNSAGGPGGSGDQSGDGSGGAIVSGHISVTGSTFSHNSAGGAGGTGISSAQGHGGAIDLAAGGSASITNSTFTLNSAGGAAGSADGGHGFGGAISIGGHATATLQSDTIDANSAGSDSHSDGGGIFGAGYVSAVGTIVSDNTVGPNSGNCDSNVLSSTDSLEGSGPEASCGFDLTSADPLLQPLADNGGPTQTQALGSGSPAIDAVAQANCPAGDQRGVSRPDGTETSCDVGAFEVQDTPTTPGPPGLSSGSTPQKTGVFTVSWTGSTSSDGDAVTYTLEQKNSGADGSTYAVVASGLTSTSYAFGSGANAAEDEGTWSFRVKAVDAGGLASAYAETTSLVVVDKTSPTVSCDLPTPVFLLGGAGGSVTASVSDPTHNGATSGAVATPVSATVSSANVSSAGAKTASLTGVDNAGNSTTVSCPYIVAYNVLGFFSPVPKAGFTAGSTIPVKFALANAAGTRIPNSEAQAIATSCRAKVQLDSGTPGCAFYATKTQTFEFDIKTSKTTTKGPHAITLKVYAADGVTVIGTKTTTVTLT
jgi:hypothetical protein